MEVLLICEIDIKDKYHFGSIIDKCNVIYIVVNMPKFMHTN